MKTDALTLKIYDKIVEFYKEQILLNLDLVTDLKSEKTIHKLPYAYAKSQKTIEVDSFSCKFVDAFDIKARYDKLLQPRERYYHFKQPATVKQNLTVEHEIVIPLPASPKRAYKPRVKPPIARLPKISIFKSILLYLKSA